MLPVTPWPLRGPGYWGSPFARPRNIELRHHPHGFRIPKGVWMIKCGPNKVEIVWREDDDFSDEPRRAPGTGMIRPERNGERQFATPREEIEAAPEPRRRPPPFPRPPPCPKPPRPPGPGPDHNRWRREELVREHSTGVVFADGWSVVLSGVGEATAIRVFST